jgi:hypothetical protein
MDELRPPPRWLTRPLGPGGRINALAVGCFWSEAPGHVLLEGRPAQLALAVGGDLRLYSTHGGRLRLLARQPLLAPAIDAASLPQHRATDVSFETRVRINTGHCPVLCCAVLYFMQRWHIQRGAIPPLCPAG